MDSEVADVMSGTHHQWLQANEHRARLRRVWAEWFESYDALLCPVMPTPAIEHQQEGDLFSRTIEVNGAAVSYMNLIAWTGLIGVVGLPSAVPPLARTPNGLPVGVQIVTPYLHDRDAIALAGQLAALAGGYETPPGF
jgi:amidase